MPSQPDRGFALVQTERLASARFAGLPPTGGDLFARAVAACDLSVCIADAQAADCPLVWVNPAFERVTGYRGTDILGLNCRFLQGANPDRLATARIAAALIDGRPVGETLLNFRADGTAFWNHVVISPMFDHAGRLTHHVGVQTDVTDRVEAEQGRGVALRQRAQAIDRLRLLAAVSEQLSHRLGRGEDILAALPEIVAAQFGGWVMVAGIGERRDLTGLFAAHAAPEEAATAPALVDALRRQLTDGETGGLITLLNRLVRPRPLVLSLAAARVDDLVRTSGLPASMAKPRTGLTVVAVPLVARGGLIGVLALVHDGTDAFDADDIAAVADLGGRAAMALDIERLHAREHDAALTLQRSLLPRLPDIGGFDVAAVYRPAETSAEVGGDWYDVLDLPGQAIGVVVGDVMGHDLNAAAAMGQLRSVLRSYAWNADPPAAVIRRLDELVRGLGMAAMATCFYATVTPDTDGAGHVVTYTSAGHPPPMMQRAADGRIERLDQALTSPIGVDDGSPVLPEASTGLEPGDTLVLYTDGLIERRTRSLDDGFDALAAAISGAPAGHSAQDLCDHVVSELHEVGTSEDDTCVLVLRSLATPTVQTRGSNGKPLADQARGAEAAVAVS
jgi:PAS domain S-box-containing protein